MKRPPPPSFGRVIDREIDGLRRYLGERLDAATAEVDDAIATQALGLAEAFAEIAGAVGAIGARAASAAEQRRRRSRR